MVSPRTLLRLGFVVAAHASCPETPGVVWAPCNETEVPSTVPLDCGALQVPLDYTEPSSNATLHLELAKVPALIQPSRGSILFNFGGPGIPGRRSLGALAGLLQALTGGQHDLVVFDPRGTGNTLPFACAESEFEAFTLMSELRPGNSSDVSLGRLWTQGEISAQTCFERADETGSLINTAFGARDLISVVDALEEDKMLRYWGMSYGSTLGATVAAMFPDKIDKLILDGVQNPHEYYHAFADFEEWTDSDKLFSGIFSTCVAARENCALARGNNATAAELEEAVWSLLDSLKYRPIRLGNIMVDYSAVKGIILQSFYDSASWPALTDRLHALLTGNLPEDVPPEFQPPVDTLLNGIRLTEAMTGIHCVDRTPRTSSFDEFLPTVRRLYKTSRIFGDVTVGTSATCAQWRIEAKERYEGDFRVQTRNPILLIGNTYDGHTPLVSAYNVSSGFEGSVVLEIHGYGHGSAALPSMCTLRTVSTYWINGTLPEPGTVCQVDAPPFSNLTWGDVLQAAGDGEVVKRDVGSVFSVGLLNRRWLM